MNQYNTLKPLNLATLKWIDRRRIWATPARETALGVTSIPVYPTLISGQAGRPTISYKYFTPTLTWLAKTLLVLNGLALAGGCLANLLNQLFTLFQRYALSYADNALHAPVTKNVTLADSHVKAFPFSQIRKPSPENTSSLHLTHALYHVIGLADAVSAHTPAMPLSPSIAKKSWAVVSLPSTCGGVMPLTAPTYRGTSTLFRSYLGEWRRLADQLQTTSLNAWLTPAQGVSLGRRSRRVHVAYASLRPNSTDSAFSPTNTCMSATRPSYGYYLASPWTF